MLSQIIMQFLTDAFAGFLTDVDNSAFCHGGTFQRGLCGLLSGLHRLLGLFALGNIARYYQYIDDVAVIIFYHTGLRFNVAYAAIAGKVAILRTSARAG